MFQGVKSYYDLGKHGYISNSRLSEVKRELIGGFRPKNLQEAYRLGLLTDSLITQIETTNSEFHFIEDEGTPGEIITYSEEEFARATLMKNAYDSDPQVQQMFEGAKTQHIITKEKFPVSIGNETVYIKACCKFDLYLKRLIGGDIKTTACRTEKAFFKVIDVLDYDRQGAFYMDLANLDKFMIIGLSKKSNRQGKHMVFKFAIKRGSDAYNRGKEKYQKLVFLNKMINE